MSFPARTALFCTLITAIATAAPNRFVARYLPIGRSDSSSLLAVDATGNFFIVATVQEPSGRQQIRVIKTDSLGNEAANFDFGSGSDLPAGAAVDPEGNLVIVGTTYAQSNSQAAFIVKLDSQVTKILFSTVLVGSQGFSSANAVTLDTAGNIYVTGSTASADFPVTPGAFQTTGPMSIGAGSPTYAFVTEISPNGMSTVFSTFFGSGTTNCNGGSICIGAVGVTSANAIALDSTGAVIIGGYTTANHLPVTPGTLGQECNCGYRPFVQSGFLAKFTPGGKQLDWATYIPLAQPGPESASGYELSITSVAMDEQGNVIFAGVAPTGLFVTKGALQTSYGTGNSAADYGASFVAKVSASASSYLFSTYFGEGVFGSIGAALALDPQGDIWLTGGSNPNALPLPSSIPRLGSTFVAELSADASSVIGGVTAPAGAAGQGIVITPDGSPAALGSAGSLLLDLAGQPASLIGVANSAGIQVSGEVAPYELVSLFGVGLGPAEALGGMVVNGALTDSLGGVQVLFNGAAAPLLYVGPTQINAIVPSAVLGQDTASVQIVTPNGTLTGPTLSVVPSEPEVFQNGPPMPGGGTAVALNQDGSLNSASNPAAGGSIVTIWATGAGESPGDLAPGSVATGFWMPALPVSVLNESDENGGQGIDSLAVLYAGDAPGMVTGVLQVNFQLPTENFLKVGQLTCQLQIGIAVSSRFSVYVQP